MLSFLIMISVLFVGAMLWAGQHALVIVPLGALLWIALLVAEVRDLRVAPVARRVVASARERAAHARRRIVSVL